MIQFREWLVLNSGALVALAVFAACYFLGRGIGALYFAWRRRRHVRREMAKITQAALAGDPFDTAVGNARKDVLERLGLNVEDYKDYLVEKRKPRSVTATEIAQRQQEAGWPSRYSLSCGCSYPADVPMTPSGGLRICGPCGMPYCKNHQDGWCPHPRKKNQMFVED